MAILFFLFSCPCVSYTGVTHYIFAKNQATSLRRNWLRKAQAFCSIMLEENDQYWLFLAQASFHGLCVCFPLFWLTTRTLSAIWSRKELQFLPSNWYPTVLYFRVHYVKTWERLSPKTLRRWVLDINSQNGPGFITVQLRKMISAPPSVGYSVLNFLPVSEAFMEE